MEVVKSTSFAAANRTVRLATGRLRAVFLVGISLSQFSKAMALLDATPSKRREAPGRERWAWPMSY